MNKLYREFYSGIVQFMKVMTEKITRNFEGHSKMLALPVFSNISKISSNSGIFDLKNIDEF